MNNTAQPGDRTQPWGQREEILHSFQPSSGSHIWHLWAGIWGEPGQAWGKLREEQAKGKNWVMVGRNKMGDGGIKGELDGEKDAKEEG